MSIRYSDDGTAWLNGDMWVSRDCRFVWNDKEWIWKPLPEDMAAYVDAKLTSMAHVVASITCEVVDCKGTAVAVARNDREGEYAFHAVCEDHCMPPIVWPPSARIMTWLLGSVASRYQRISCKN